MRWLIGYIVVLAVMTNLPALSHAHADAPHPHKENAIHHHDEQEAAPVGHRSGHDEAVTAEEYSLHKAITPGRHLSSHDDDACCSLVGGVCVVLIFETPGLPARDLIRDFPDGPSMAISTVLLSVAPPPPKPVSSIRAI